MLLNGLTCTTPTAGEGTVSCSFTTVPNPNTSFERCLETTELGGQFCISFQPTVPLPPPVIALPPAPVVVAPLPAPPVVVAAPPIVTVAPPQPPLAGTLPAWNPLAPALPLPAPPQPPPTPPQPVVPVNAALVSTDSYSRMFTLIVVCLSHPSSSIDPSIYLFAFLFFRRFLSSIFFHNYPVVVGGTTTGPCGSHRPEGSGSGRVVPTSGPDAGVGCHAVSRITPVCVFK